MSKQISTLLFDVLSQNPFPITGLPEDKLQQIQNFIQLKDSILELGDREHTGDWDPYILITLNDGSTIESQNGYHEIQTQFPNILLEDEYDQGQQKDEDISYHIIPLTTISTITLLR